MNFERCRQCNQQKEVVFHSRKLSHGSFLKTDLRGKRWNAKQCPDCFRFECKMNRRKAGSKPIDLVTEPRIKKGRDAERLVAEYFINAGYSVKLTEVNGPDLLISDQNKMWTMEVKSVSKGSRNRWRVSKVSELRKKDDFIAIVLDEKVILIQSMQEHLKNCGNSGYRNVVKYHPEYRPKPRSIHA